MTTFAGWQISLEAQVRASAYGYDQPAARYNDPNVVYGGGDPDSWVRVDCQLLRVSAKHGGRAEQIPGIRASLGTLTASLYDPDRLFDPAATPFALLTTPGVPVRLIAISPAGVSFPLWTGISDSFDHDLLTGEGELHASDRVALIAGTSLTEWTRPQENSRSRLEAINNELAEPLPFVFEGNPVPMAASKMSGDLWSSSVATVSESEQSIVWLDQAGTFRRRDTATTPNTPVICVDCDDGTSPIVYTRLSSRIDDDMLANLVYAERVGITDERALRLKKHPGSLSKFGPVAMKTRNDLLVIDDASLDLWMQRILDLKAIPKVEPTEMAIGITDVFPWVDRTVPAVIALRVSTVLDIRLSSRGAPARWTPVIGGISHTITPTDWNVQLDLVESHVLFATPPPGGGGGGGTPATGGYDAVGSVYDVTKYATAVITPPPPEVPPPTPVEPPPPPPPPDPVVPTPPPTQPPPPSEVVVNGGTATSIQNGLDTAKAQGKTLRLTGTFTVAKNVHIPSNVHIVATGATFQLSDTGRFRNGNSTAGAYGQPGGFVWDGGYFDGNGDGVFTMSHCPGFTIQNATFWDYCTSTNKGHAIEINSSGGKPTSGYTCNVLSCIFRGVLSQRSNSNDEPVSIDYAWDGSGVVGPFDGTVCNNVRIANNTFHRLNESGTWKFALCAIGGHDPGGDTFPSVPHKNFLIEGNGIHGAVGSTGTSPNKGAIHLFCMQQVVVRNNTLYGGVQNRYITAERAADVKYCTTSGNASANPTLSNPNTITVAGREVYTPTERELPWA